jgi:flagellar basal body rod protein FlgC
MPDHQERPPSALAHGAVKCSDIERVREEVDKSGARVAHEEKVSAARRERLLRVRAAEREQDVQP